MRAAALFTGAQGEVNWLTFDPFDVDHGLPHPRTGRWGQRASAAGQIPSQLSPRTWSSKEPSALAADVSLVTQLDLPTVI